MTRCSCTTTLRALVLACAVAAAGCSGYRPGTLLREPGDSVSVRVLQCLELAIEPRPDAVADRRPVLRVRFGNRCYQDTVLNLEALRVTGHYFSTGPWEPVPLYDPHRSLEQGPLDGRAQGEVWIALDAGVWPRQAMDMPLALRIELDGVEQGARHTPPVCLHRAAPLRYADAPGTMPYEVVPCDGS